jgi:LacI family transcriptional regulator
MKRPTQVDVARLAGVSRATVSYVVNGLDGGRIPISEETRQRVLEAIEELGYQPDARAQALRSGRTKAIGLIIPDLALISTPSAGKTPSKTCQAGAWMG